VVLGEGELVSDVLLSGIYFMIRSNMALCVSVCVSLICNFYSLKLCMRDRSHVFNMGPFFQCAIYPLFSMW
jgi:hypothetical protein